MNQYLSILFFCLIFLASCQGQTIQDRPTCSDEAFDKSVNNWLNFTVPLKGVKDLSKENLKNYLILDAREENEFKVSHIEGAKHIGYDKFSIKALDEVDKERAIVVYCSIGYRSEKIGEKLQEAGFKNVYNLYGSIFEWANQGLPLVDDKGEKTNKVHTYNRKWSKWVLNKDYEKIW